MAARARGYGARRWGAAGLLAGALLLPAAAPAEEPEPGAPGARPERPAGEDAASEGGEPAAEPEPAPRKPYESVGPSERRGRTFDPGELRSETSDPAFGARSHELDEHPGSTRPLEEVSRSPGPREEEREPLPVPAPLRIRRPLGEAPPADAPLPDRLCESERDLAHARLAFAEAVRAYKRARRDEYPRGDHKFLVVEHRAIAQRRLRRAEAAHAALLSEAEAKSFDFEPTECARAAPAAPRPAPPAPETPETAEADRGAP
jgi:hypothetical protein